jgi:hypothetical protein
MACIDGSHHMQIAVNAQRPTGQASCMILIDMSGQSVEGDCCATDGACTILSLQDRISISKRPTIADRM